MSPFGIELNKTHKLLNNVPVTKGVVTFFPADISLRNNNCLISDKFILFSSISV